MAVRALVAAGVLCLGRASAALAPNTTEQHQANWDQYVPSAYRSYADHRSHAGGIPGGQSHGGDYQKYMKEYTGGAGGQSHSAFQKYIKEYHGGHHADQSQASDIQLYADGQFQSSHYEKRMNHSQRTQSHGEDYHQYVQHGHYGYWYGDGYYSPYTFSDQLKHIKAFVNQFESNNQSQGGGYLQYMNKAQSLLRSELQGTQDAEAHNKFVDNSVDKLLDRARKASFLHHAELDAATLGKRGRAHNSTDKLVNHMSDRAHKTTSLDRSELDDTALGKGKTHRHFTTPTPRRIMNYSL